MQGALLRTGKSDQFIAMGETGQPVFKAALQLIAALERRSPELSRFLAIPKSNEQGNVLDWYSPLPGEVIAWRAATEAERDSARERLQHFRQAVLNSASSLVESAGKRGQGDQVIFGKLLGLVPFCPSDDHVYLVQTEQGVQPVLTFWGFVAHEQDRQREPLYFLTPRPTPTPPPVAAPLAPEPTPAPVFTPPPASVPVERARPWWRRWWWLWLLLALLLLALLFGLLRGCAPQFGVPGLAVDAPRLERPTTGVPAVTGPGAPAVGTPVPTSGTGLGASAGIPGASVGSALPDTGAPVPDATAAPAADEAAAVPADASDTPADATPAPTADTPDAQAGNAPVAPPAPASGTAPPLTIPADAGEGPADFLNGNYRAGAGILDASTAKPLRLEYAFENGQGNVTIRRPDGVSCTGAVNAAMRGGQLGIESQDQATCTDGGRYDMPTVSCAPGAQRIADCQGHYGSSQFPISMRRE
ncbi:SrfA family protein [Enterobacterales bacterium AW_CKDN230030176-1A_HGKHYDSX7]